jgi:hypothetical protein
MHLGFCKARHICPGSLAWRQPSQTKELKQQNESAELLSKRII